jgi:hypothetical protein
MDIRARAAERFRQATARFLAPLLAILFVVAFVRDVGRLDEMKRRIHLQPQPFPFC